MKKISILTMLTLMVFLVSCALDATTTQSSTNVTETTTNVTETSTTTELETTINTTTESITTTQTTTLIVEPTYDSDNWLRVMSTDYKFGMIDINGTVTLPLEYDNSEVFRNGVAIVRKDDHDGLINEELEIVIPFVYDTLCSTSLSNEYFFASEGKVYKYLYDKEGNVIYEFNETFVHETNNEDWIVVYNGEYYGLYDMFGNQIMDFIYNELKLIGDSHFYSVSAEYGRTIINLNQDILVSNVMGNFNMINEEYILQYDNHIATVYDLTGTMLVTIPTNVNLQFSEDLVSFYHQDGKYGIIDINGNILSAPTYTLVSNYYNGLGLFQKLWTDGTNQIIFSTDGTILYATSEDEIKRFTDNAIILQDGETHYFYLIDYEGNVLIEPKANDILCAEDFYGNQMFFRAEEGLSLYRKYEAYDSNGQFLMLLEANTQFTFNGNNGLICKYTDVVTVINLEGDALLEVDNVKNILLYNYGIVVEYLDNTAALYDIEGNLLIPPLYFRIGGLALEEGFDIE